MMRDWQILPEYRETELPWNPLFDEWVLLAQRAQRRGDHERYIEPLKRRDQLVTDYAFSVPTGPVIMSIAQLAPRIVELGAGTGYWAKLLSDAGADVVAYDKVVGANHYMKGQQIGRWFDVRPGDVDALAQHADRSLFLCWPPYEESVAADALDVWQGDIGSLVIYVGEGWGGCCADDAFFKKLETEFEDDKSHLIPQFWGLHDYVSVYRRKAFKDGRTTPLKPESEGERLITFEDVS